ncbi:NagD-like protein [Paenibacillus larvae subsp. larvae]|uniref:Acid sugar phosphatase n=2 Tax=Paenibacillus larvae TaxID=1464 RepID=A0A2L1U4K7_9BACL|nr:TIGR01457 family HAD-type hydrolase [Paenibacillus larvae]AQZ46185.1 HAD family hydrolase [Paenibacillus larvae subsp. pulvifaciens]ARF67524.1 HAD family hydrolase [Paenibacillus larvae subsp. pulvifaciens]AVF27852.1 NagD-like protein [Paenibacillus larvae subsp. larvae]AVF32355.1 NagD-like protein [Paenibacillus larvae subsp. larvae]MBH0341499.1 HAD family hydrolase [Paenibacillus larvae]
MKGFLIDLDGTLYKGKTSIPGADKFIRKLYEHDIPFMLVTNNSSRTTQGVSEHLESMGVHVEPENIYTSAQASARYLTELHEGASVYAIGENGLFRALEEKGLKLTSEHPQFVVQGINRKVTYDQLACAVQFILDGASFILTNPDHLLPSDHVMLPGAGSIAALIEKATQVKPVVIGKPSPIIMNFALEKIGLIPGEVCVIGDNLNTDIRGGRDTGCHTALVLTGLTTEDNKETLIKDTGVTPDFICKDLDDLWNQIMNG